MKVILQYYYLVGTYIISGYLYCDSLFFIDVISTAVITWNNHGQQCRQRSTSVAGEAIKSDP